MNEIIIFCQAPVDVAYCLYIYDKYIDKSRISIYVINVKGIYEFLESLNLNLKNLVFIPYNKYISIRNPFIIRKEKKRISELYNIYFYDCKNAEVYFFYRVFDWITNNFVAKLSLSNKVNFVGIDNPQDLPFTVVKNNIAKLFELWVIKYITGIKFRFIKNKFGIMLDFDYVDKFDIKRISLPEINLEIYNKYCYKADNIIKPALLFFEQNQKDYDFYANYEKELNIIMDILQKENVNIYIKPHPRQMYSSFIKDRVKGIIPAFVPGEFLNFDDFNLIIGIETVAIANCNRFAEDKTYSLLELFSFKDPEQKSYIKSHLNSLSNNKLKYISSYQELSEIINKNFFPNKI
ncbi:MAG: hypothetical protein Q8880_08595 [Bacteroidota bacterium]|nr:hypothetical protein [Bacteroidota bacterium]